MKLSTSVLYYIFALSIGAVVSKNVANINFNENTVKNALLELEQNEFNLGKREAKNVVNLNMFVDEDEYKLRKRDAKHVVDLNMFIDDDLEKRDGKNVFNTKLILDDVEITKRDGKNVFGLKLVVDEDEDKLYHKRESKNVVNINLKLDDEYLVKRDEINIGLVIPENNIIVSKLKNPESVGFIVGNDQYVLKSLKKENNQYNIGLKKHRKGCHGKKSILNLESLSDILNAFKKKVADSVANTKDKFVIPSEFNGKKIDTEKFQEEISSKNPDLITSISQRPDLSLFAKYLRDVPDAYLKCESVDNQKSEKQILILAPTNDAIMSIGKKPWEFPQEVESATSEEEEATIIKNNISNFVESHLVETDNFNFNAVTNTVEFTTFNGKKLSVKRLNGQLNFKLEDSSKWVSLVLGEIFDNGAILTIDESLIQ